METGEVYALILFAGRRLIDSGSGEECEVLESLPTQQLSNLRQIEQFKRSGGTNFVPPSVFLGDKRGNTRDGKGSI